ncbi:MAG: nucleotidyltransferase family protein [Pseudobdellovibrio sp.]
MKFGLEEDQYQILENIIISPLKKYGAKVWIFGSRAKGTHRKFSDVDLMYEAQNELPKGFVFEITSQLEESNFEYKLDLVHRKDVAQSYKDSIESSKIEIK